MGHNLVKRQEALDLRVEGLSYKEISVRFGVSRQRIHQLIAPPSDVRDAIVKKYKGECAKCKLIVGTSGHVHHKENISDDYNDMGNLELLCPSCHMKAHNKLSLKPKTYHVLLQPVTFAKVPRLHKAKPKRRRKVRSVSPGDALQDLLNEYRRIFKCRLRHKSASILKLE